MRCPHSTPVLRGLVTASCGVLTGCSYPPSINVFGPYFPDWLFCWLAGVALMLLCHGLLTLTRLQARVPAIAFTYTLLTACFSLGVWLVFFPS